MKPKIFISFLMPYPIRGIEAPYLWIFYKQLSAFKNDQIVFIGSSAYIKEPSMFDDPRNELTAEGAKHFNYDMPSPEKIAGYRFIEFDPALLNDMEERHAHNSDQVFKEMLLYKDDSVIRYLETAFSNLKNDYDILGILSWCNIPSLSAAADTFAIPVIHNELGALRSPLYVPTAYFDFNGVNGNTESETRFARFKKEVEPHNLLSLPEIHNLIVCSNNLLRTSDAPLYDFGIVLQVEDDSNILAFSNGFDSISLIKWVKSTFKNKTICLREHPGGHLHYDKLGDIDHSINTLGFLSRCDTIVTINSSVALEALLFEKKALILGDNPFKFLTQFDDPDELLYGLNFAVFSYLIPYDFLFDYDYYLWRLNNRNEAAIFDKHVAYYREKKIDLCRQTPIAAENTETISTPFIQLFFDVGEGICEEASIKMSVSAGDYIQECVFDLSDKNFTNLRLDPLNDSCVIEIESLLLVEENEMQIDLTTEISTNCCSRSEKRFFFETDDSQIFLRVPNESEPSKAKKLIVSIRYVYIGREAVHACVSQILHNKAEEIAALSRTFEKELSDKEHTIAIKEEALQNTYAELVSTQNKLSQILSSNSWRITAPLRYLGENVRKSVSILVFALKTIRYLYKNPTIILRAFNELRYSGIQKTWLKIRNKSKKIEGFIASQKHSTLFNNIVDQFHDVPFIPQFAINKPIDIIIPVYNGKEFLLPLFESIIRNTSMPYRLFVADDKSSDRDILPLLYEIQKKHPFISMTIIENEMNLGFIKTVNKLSKMCENHFVLLNTDTEVPPQWIERLMYPIFKMEGIASTTPFTNSGTICSFPNYLEDNPIFEGLSVEEVDKQFRYVNFEKTYITVPTGVGFCMGVNKKVVDQIGMFDEIYGKGYSEENDWCQRAIQHGYKNLHVTNLFVYHKHGGSFSSEEKQKLQRKNMEILLSRYPHYAHDVDLTVTTDALKKVRELLKKRLIRDKHESSLSLSTKVGRDSIKVYYIGYLSSSSGVGRASSGYIQALHSLGFDVVTFDLVSHDWTNHLVDNIYDDLPSFVIYHFNANELLTLDKTFLQLIKKLSYVIGIWAWESNHPNPDFKNASIYVDQIWSISHYMLDALRETSCRTNVLLHIIEDQTKCAFEINDSVETIRKNHSFVVGYMFDLNSYAFRKNPLGVIEAFNNAFHDIENAALILKISGSKYHSEEFQQIEEASKIHSHIYIIDAFWSDKEINFFYRSIDVYLALFRAEGFGLTIAEAMAHGVPIICTRYSGVLDYIGDAAIAIDYRSIEIPKNWGPYQKGWQWADPDIDQASQALLHLFSDPSARESYRQKGLTQITDTLSINVIGDKMLRMLIDAKTDPSSTLTQSS